MNETNKTIKYETPIATESDLGAQTILVSCNHGWARQAELAFTIRTVLAEKGSNKRVRLMPGGWTGVVDTMVFADESGSPAHIFFSHLEQGGYLIVASEPAYNYFIEILKVKKKTNLSEQLVYLNAYADAEEAGEELKVNGLI